MRKYLFFVLIGLVFWGCRKEKFVSESNWVVPIFESELNLGNAIADSLTENNVDGSINVVFESEYGVSDIDDIVQIPDTVEVSEVTLSSLVLDDRSFKDTLTLLEIYPASALLTTKQPYFPVRTYKPTRVL